MKRDTKSRGKGKKSRRFGRLAVLGVLVITIMCLVVVFSDTSPNAQITPTAIEAINAVVDTAEIPSKPSATKEPTEAATVTHIPDPIEVVRDRFDNPDLMLYEEYNSTELMFEDEVLKINIVRKDGDEWGYESLQDLSSFLHLALVDCTKYRFGHGIEGCKIMETAPYKYVEIREFLPSGDLKVFVRFSVGNRKYFAGYDGTAIISSKVLELADEYSFSP